MAAETGSTKKYRKVGKIKDAHALKGELYVLIFSGEWDWFDELEDFKIVSLAGEEKILHIEGGRPHKDGLIIKPKEISDRTPAEKVKGWEFQIPEELLETSEGETPYLSELLEFKVMSEEREIGISKDFLWNGDHDLIVVENPDKRRFEIPFVDAFIVEVDYDKKLIHMSLPDGLLEINDAKKDEH